MIYFRFYNKKKINIRNKEKTFPKNWKIAKYEVRYIFYMSTISYLMHILYGQGSVMNTDFILVVIPVLSITVLMFGLRSIIIDTRSQKLKKQ